MRAYCTRDDVLRVNGALEKENQIQSISDLVFNWHIDRASDQLRGNLAPGFDVLTFETGDLPPNLVRLAAYLAAISLHQSNRIGDLGESSAVLLALQAEFQRLWEIVLYGGVWSALGAYTPSLAKPASFPLVSPPIFSEVYATGSRYGRAD